MDGWGKKQYESQLINLFRDLEEGSKCQTVITEGTCKIDLCFVHGAGDGKVGLNRVVDIATKLIKEGKCAVRPAEYPVDNPDQYSQIGGLYTIDKPSVEWKGDKCKAPSKAMKVEFDTKKGSTWYVINT
ncbi:hypothetical protein GGR53DRAFT_466716 [Hypoxylon sp. FL1150]|nr:hypothetical protein GGR53DRAFT_466716 [Hypoxylon sp. FL1150]